jgi:hypothetical protein
MYDTIEIPKEFLPIPKKLINSLPDILSFQTDDLGENLDFYLVDPDGQLIEYFIADSVYHYLNHDYTGEMKMGGYIGSVFRYYKAVFLYGKLISITDNETEDIKYTNKFFIVNTSKLDKVLITKEDKILFNSESKNVDLQLVYINGLLTLKTVLD